MKWVIRPVTVVSDKPNKHNKHTGIGRELDAMDKPMVWFHVPNHTWIGTWNTKMALEEWSTMTNK